MSSSGAGAPSYCWGDPRAGAGAPSCCWGNPRARAGAPSCCWGDPRAGAGTPSYCWGDPRTGAGAPRAETPWLPVALFPWDTMSGCCWVADLQPRKSGSLTVVICISQAIVILQGGSEPSFAQLEFTQRHAQPR